MCNRSLLLFGKLAEWNLHLEQARQKNLKNLAKDGYMEQLTAVMVGNGTFLQKGITQYRKTPSHNPAKTYDILLK